MHITPSDTESHDPFHFDVTFSFEELEAFELSIVIKVTLTFVPFKYLTLWNDYRLGALTVTLKNFC